MADPGNHVMIDEVLVSLSEQLPRRVNAADRTPDLEFECAGAGNGELTLGRDASRRQFVVSDDLLGEQNLARYQHISRVLRRSVRSAIHLPLLAD
jgi:hypothetical protein